MIPFWLLLQVVGSNGFLTDCGDAISCRVCEIGHVHRACLERKNEVMTFTCKACRVLSGARTGREELEGSGGPLRDRQSTSRKLTGPGYLAWFAAAYWFG